MATTIQTTGTLAGGQVVTLDQPIPLKAGRVKITMEVVPSEQPEKSFLEGLEEIWAAQRARGHVPRSAEEVEAQIREERESWND